MGRPPKEKTETEITLTEDSIEKIKDCPGVGDTILSKLKNAGFTTLSALIVNKADYIAENSGIGLETVQKITEFAVKNKHVASFVYGYDELKRLYGDRERFTTLSISLNNLLGGGIETRTITEAYGQFSSGKTNLAHQLAVTVQLPKEQGGLDGQVVFIDSEGTFRMERIEAMALALNLDPKKVFENIFVTRVFTSDQQILAMENVWKLAKDHNIRLLIIDSLTALFRVEFIGRGELQPRQSLLNSHIRQLTGFAEVNKAAVYVTNQVISDPSVQFADPIKPVGGNIMGHAGYYRLYLRKGGGSEGRAGKRVARLVDSPHLPENECVFQITKEGIRDTDEKIKEEKEEKEE